jgi:hypothetical protein
LRVGKLTARTFLGVSEVFLFIMVCLRYGLRYRFEVRECVKGERVRNKIDLRCWLVSEKNERNWKEILSAKYDTLLEWDPDIAKKKTI